MPAFFTNAFPLWILLAGSLALVRPEIFTWFTGPLITLGLGIIMLGMGLTLEARDFARVFKCPSRVAAGLVLQYTVMPFLGWALAAIFRLPPALAAGLILVSCCPGGTASNVVAYLARADVPLSVTMTAVSTFSAVVMTPFLTTLLASSRVEVNTPGLLFSTVQVVILPVAAGVVMNRFLPRVTQRLLPAAPPAAVIFITLIVASIVGAGRDEIIRAGLPLLAAVFMLHAAGFLFGYVLSRALLRDETAARTVSIEVGMQNSGLGVVLARANFAHPATAIPSAISSVFHSLIGSLLAALWRTGKALPAAAAAAAMLVFIPAAPAAVERYLPEDYIKYPVLVTMDSGQAASGFYITAAEGSAYFVTARHLFFEEDGRTLRGARAILLSYPREEEYAEPIFVQLDLPELMKHGMLYVHETQDVTAVRLGTITESGAKKSLVFSPGVHLASRGGKDPGEGSLVGAQEEVIKKYGDVAIGNEIFIFGFPGSLGIENYPQLDYLKPLLRKGIVAGKNDEKQSIIIDCPAYYGNSGGPVVEVVKSGLTETRYYVIGMVAEFIPFEERWYGAGKAWPGARIENSGYSVVIPMDTILDLIRRSEEAAAGPPESESE